MKSKEMIDLSQKMGFLPKVIVTYAVYLIIIFVVTEIEPVESLSLKVFWYGLLITILIIYELQFLEWEAALGAVANLFACIFGGLNLARSIGFGSELFMAPVYSTIMSIILHHSYTYVHHLLKNKNKK